MNLKAWLWKSRLRTRFWKRVRRPVIVWKRVDTSKRDVFTAAALAAGVMLGASAKADTPFTSYAFPATGTSTTRTMPDRLIDIRSIKEFGAVGGGIADDGPAIRTAIATLYVSPFWLYFPGDNYKVIGQIDFSGGSGKGRISGAGRGATFIFGTNDSGFIFSLPNEQAGVQEISDMTITNGSSVLGTGAVRWLDTDTNSTFRNVFFNGQIGLDIAWNSFGVNVFSCKASPTTPNQIGTAGIVSNGCNLIGYRASNYDVAFMGMGNNGHALVGNSAEVCAIGFLLGMYQGWAGACTVSGNILTVGGEISPKITVNSTQPSFVRFANVYGNGITGQVWGDPLSGPTIIGDGNPIPISSYTYNSGTGLVTLTMVSAATFANGQSITVSDLNIAGLNGTRTAISVTGGGFTVTFTGPTGQAGSPSGGGSLVDNGLTGIGGAGTYRLSNSFTISTPQPIFTRIGFLLKAAKLDSVETEGCYHGIYINSMQGCEINGGSLGGVVGEAARPGAQNGLTAHSHLYISGMTGSTIKNVIVGNGTYKSAIYFDSAGHTADCEIKTSQASATANAVSDSAATIVGTAMHINSTVSGDPGAWGIGMTVTGIGVSANTIITDITDATHFVVSPSQNVSATTLTALGGLAWIFPTTSSSAAGLSVTNCNNQTAYILTFSQLPGQVGVDADVILKEGLVFSISDGQKSGGGTALFADIVAGGSTGRYSVRYNGTNWIRTG